MIIPREHIEEQRNFVGKLQRIKYIHFRDLYPNIDSTNFQICTKVDFKLVKNTYNNINETWDRLKQSNKLIYEFTSKTGSQYFIDDKDNVYRLSDHWGAVASCEWTIESRGQFKMSVFKTGDWEIGFVNLKDFRILRRKVDRKIDILINPKWLNQIKIIVPLRNKLLKIKNSKNFKELSDEDKKLIGGTYCFLNNELKILEESCNKLK